MAEVQRVIPMQRLAASMQKRLWAGGRRSGNVVWTDRGASVVVYPTSLRVRVDDGWMVTAVDLETDQTGRETLELVFFVGRANKGDGLVATTTLDGDDPSGLRTRWGEPVQAAIWDGVLDQIQAHLDSVRGQLRNESCVVTGFHASKQGLHIHVEETNS